MDVELPSDLWYTNQLKVVRSIDINFNNGNGFINMPFNTAYKLEYMEGGIYDWIYKLTLTNGQILYSQSRIIIEQTAPTKKWKSSIISKN
ncbi:hypothetical protein [Psychroflexus tropicus]|uniref:hypothetical protein n=1 Tax=Psychroflexus tropicus TaxID=197345 RepID=UPI0003738325|nr:hypothetical protein [Psychroflexus tropicus]